MQLAHLRTFLTVYRAGSLRRGAAQLHLSQPAVTAHLLVIATRTAGRHDVEFEPLFEEQLVLVAAPTWAQRLDAAAIASAGAVALEGALIYMTHPVGSYDARRKPCASLRLLR